MYRHDESVVASRIVAATEHLLPKVARRLPQWQRRNHHLLPSTATASRTQILSCYQPPLSEQTLTERQPPCLYNDVSVNLQQGNSKNNTTKLSLLSKKSDFLLLPLSLDALPFLPWCTRKNARRAKSS
jgi:hypothetical protein